MRGVAVGLVVFAHYQSRFLTGGFLGVDIFFVLSGYLITGILARGLERGTLSLKAFYLQRARRILPALLTMLLVVGLIGLAVMPAQELLEFGGRTIALLLLAVNLPYSRMEGYFQPIHRVDPLVPTWSIAVEEQFYLLLPIILWVVWQFGRRRRIATFSGLAAVSFGCCWWFAQSNPDAGYYLLPSRAWELGLGVVLALILHRARVDRDRAHLREIVAGGGAAAIALSVCLMPPDTSFWGPTAMPLCLGVAAIIWTGRVRPGDPLPLVNRLLASPVPVALGVISYSLYLWHWPILVGAAYLSIDSYLSGQQTILLLPLTVATGWLSWRWIEQPFREPLRIDARRFVVTVGAAWLMVAGIAGTVWLGDGLPGRSTVAVAARTAEGIDVSSCDHQSAAFSGQVAATCRFGTGPVRTIVIGDSFAWAMTPAIPALASMGHGAVELIYRSGCLVGQDVSSPPQPGLVQPCDRHNVAVLRYIRSHPEIRNVIIVSRWAARRTLPGDGPKPFDRIPPSQRFDRATQQLANVLHALDTAGRHVIVIHSVPEAGRYAEWEVAVAALHSAATPAPFRPADRSIETAAMVHAAPPGVRFIDAGRVLCPSGLCQISPQPGVSDYYDWTHLSPSGAAKLLPALAEALDTLDPHPQRF